MTKTAQEHSESEDAVDSERVLGLKATKMPKRCPECRSTRIVRYLYGYRCYTDKEQAELNAGRAMPGGCCVGSDSPEIECQRCGWHIVMGASPDET